MIRRLSSSSAPSTPPLALLVLLVLSGGCSSTSTWAKRPRMQPVHERSPFGADPLGVGGQQARPRLAHQRSLKRLLQTIDLRRHPSCIGLQVAHRCPLLAHPWSTRQTPGGVELEARLTPKEAGLLAENLRCHISLGRRLDRRPDQCVLQMHQVQAVTSSRNGLTRLSVTTSNPAIVAELRERIRNLTVAPVNNGRPSQAPANKGHPSHAH